MWKIAIGFVVFAAIAMFVVIKGGDKLDMGGEKHGVDTMHAPEPAASAAAAAASAAPAVPAAAPASAASAPASAAK